MHYLGGSPTPSTLHNSSNETVYVNLLFAVRDIRLVKWTYGIGCTIGPTKSTYSTVDGVDWLTYQVSIKLPPVADGKASWFRPVLSMPTGVLVSKVINWVLTTNTVPVSDGIGPVFTSQEYLTDPWLGDRGKRDGEEAVGAADGTPVTSPVSSGSAVAVAAPENGFYGLYQMDGSDFMYLYHQVFSRYPGRFTFSNVWVFNRDPKVAGRGVLYQKTVNGDGWLYLPSSQPSWDAGTWHFIGVEAAGDDKWRLLSEDGKYLFWGDGTVIGAYNGSKATYNLGYTTDRSKAIVLTFRPEPAAW